MARLVEMRFHEFQKISTSTSQYVLSKKDATSLMRKSEWVATEKVHGANFSVYHQPAANETRFAKRGSFLDDNEYFYGAETIRDRLRVDVAVIASHVLVDDSSSSYVIIYGELFGGFYPAASDAAMWRGAVSAGRVNINNECILPLEQRAVQEGIYYSDQLAFAVFDIVSIEVLPNGIEVEHFLDYDAIQIACNHAQMLCLRPLIRGTFAEVSSFPYASFDSTLGTTVFGLPRLPPGSNRAEGVVIKPTKTRMVTDAKGNLVRCMVKLKNPAFVEISGDFSVPVPTAALRLASMVNGNRVACLLSKHGGRVTITNRSEMTQRLVDDVLEDFYINFPEAQSGDWEKDMQMLQSKCREIIDRTVI